MPERADREDVVRRRLVGLRVLLRGEEDVFVARHGGVERVDDRSRPTKSCETMCGNTMMSRSGRSGTVRRFTSGGPLPSLSLLKNIDTVD